MVEVVAKAWRWWTAKEPEAEARRSRSFCRWRAELTPPPLSLSFCLFAFFVLLAPGGGSLFAQRLTESRKTLRGAAAALSAFACPCEQTSQKQSALDPRSLYSGYPSSI